MLSGRPGRSQVAPRASRGASGEPPLAIQTTLGRSPSAFGTPKRVRTATTSNFRRFLVRAWEGRTSIFASQRSVLLTWDEERTERQHAAKKWRRDTIFEPKSVSVGRSGRLGRAKKRFLRAIKSARSTSGVSAKFFCRCERGKKREKERMLGDVECAGG